MERNRKRLLLSGGERLFGQSGYRSVSIRDITSAAGLGMGSFYTYFPSKESFYSNVVDLIEERAAKEITRHVSSLRSPSYRLKALFRWTNLTLRASAILRGLYGGERRFLYPGAEERVQNGTTLFAHVRSLLTDILAEGTRTGAFRTGLFKDPRRMLMAVFTAVSLASGTEDSTDLAEDMMLLVERGMRRWLRFRQRAERLDVRARRKSDKG